MPDAPSDSGAMPVTAYIALGSNLGDCAANLARAIELLRADPRIAVTRVSTAMDNPAVGGPADSPAFLNAAAEVRTEMGPGELLGRLLEVERAMGRVRRQRWGPRTIDLDLLLYGDRVIDQPSLTVPHPRMHERRFVLVPLAEIAPDAIHPVLGRSIRVLLESLPA